MSRDDNEYIASNSEASAIMSYRPPGAYIEREAVEWMRNPDGTVLLDHKNRPLSVDKILATKPLRQEISTRPGPDALLSTRTAPRMKRDAML